MACGSCGKKRETISPAQAQALARTPTKRATYTVTPSDGSESKTFDNYLDAAVYRKQTSGSITTTTG